MRMRTIALLIQIAGWLILGALTAWSWTAADRASRMAAAESGVNAREDVVYQTVDGRPIKLDIYTSSLPTTPEAWRPAILAIHGGSWIGGSKRLFRPDARNPLVSRLIGEGYVVLAVDYRLARPGAPGWPAALDDVRAAVRWTRRNAGELGIDPDRIFALGQSSGAHLAAMLGTLPGPADPGGVSAHVQAVVNFYGPSDLNRLANSRHSLAHDPTRVFLGDGPTPFQARAAEASPIAHVSSDDAPMLLLHGRNDSWVPLEQSERLAAKLKQAGVHHQLVIVDGASHGFGPIVKTQPEFDLFGEILGFLKTVGNAQSR
jgi:acetyl esterase/lipase